MIYPKINILILNWNGLEVLYDCVKSILKSDYSNYIVTIIDNGSTDLSLNSISELVSKKISFIYLKDNIGYSKAYNYAIKKLVDNDDDYYFLLNNDTIIEKDTISKLVFYLNKYGKHNIYGSKIINFYNNNLWYAGGKINRIIFSATNIGVNQKDQIVEYKTTKTDFISGCALLINKKILNKLGGLNEIYTFYYEDVDLCLKAKSKGIDSIFVNNSVVFHKISHSMAGRYSLKKVYYKFISKFKFIFSNNSLIKSVFYMSINLILFPFYFTLIIIRILLLK